MKHIIKVETLQNLPETRPLLALDSNGVLFAEGVKAVPGSFVDFGLPSGTLWYNKNIGATNGNTPESWYGNYYAWGEVETKSKYKWYDIDDPTVNYKYGAPNLLTKYCPSDKHDYWRSYPSTLPDNILELESCDDAATIANESWKIPSKTQYEELMANTVSSWETNYQGIEGLNGRLFTKLIITPAFKNITLYDEEGSLDEYWEEMSEYTLEEINEEWGVEDIRDLIFKDENCTQLAEYGVDYRFIVRQTDPTISIFMPANGYIKDTTIYRNGIEVREWTRNLYTSNPNFAYRFYSKESAEVLYDERYLGIPVRPVSQ